MTPDTLTDWRLVVAAIALLLAAVLMGGMI